MEKAVPWKDSGKGLITHSPEATTSFTGVILSLSLLLDI